MLPDAVAGRVGLVCAQLGAAQKNWSWRFNLAPQVLWIADRSEKSFLETPANPLSAIVSVGPVWDRAAASYSGASSSI